VDNGATAIYYHNSLGQRVRKVAKRDLPGDANGDGTVDQADRGALVDHILNIATAANPDCNQDGQVNIQDRACVNNEIANGNTSATRTTLFVYDQNAQLQGEYDADGVPVQEYVWFDGMPVAVLKDGQVYVIYSDHLGTPRAIADNNNTIIWQWDSDPFGRALPNEDVDGDGKRFELNLRFPGPVFRCGNGVALQLPSHV
jgi:hypothetical protein